MNSTILKSALVGLLLAAPGIAAADWTGAYGGIALSYGDGDTEDLTFGPGPFDIDGGSVDLFGGYNWQNGQIVYGVEGALSIGGPDGTDGAFAIPFEVQNAVSLRGRIGVDSGQWLPYGFLGVSSAKVEIDHDGAGTNIADDRFSGVSLGFGVDYMVNDNSFVRFEVSRTRYDAQQVEFLGADFHDYDDTDVTTFTIGYAMKF